MKIEDAIKTLKELRRETNDPWYEEVYNMAINALGADRKTENNSEKPNNCDDEPQTNADQHVQHVESVETMSCQECKHWNGNYGECTEVECHYAPKDESQSGKE